MGVRLNKVLSELNIGLQTAVDFLKKKIELGEVKDEMTSNTKISDEQYQALVNEFSTDKDVKSKAEMLFAKKQPKEKKVEKKVIASKELEFSDGIDSFLAEAQDEMARSLEKNPLADGTVVNLQVALSVRTRRDRETGEERRWTNIRIQKLAAV